MLSLLLTTALAASFVADDEMTKPDAKSDPLHPHVRMVTNHGEIVLELDAEKAPITVDNFLTYAEEDHYKGTIFHRVMSNFMIQGGGFTPDMTQKPTKHPSIRNEWNNGLKNVRGTIAMARTAAPNSATAQFFINVVDNANLDQPISGGAGYAVFGKVVEGMDVVDKIRNTKVARHPKYPSPTAVTPEEPVVIEKVGTVGKVDRAKIRAMAEERKSMKPENPVDKVVADWESKSGGKFTKTPSGLMILSLKDGTGNSPEPTDRVEVHYRGTLLNGSEFDSSYKRGKSAEFPLNGVIGGWTEGVGMMKEGGKAVLICPPDLAYGSRGSRTIPPNSTLVFEVELISIK